MLWGAHLGKDAAMELLRDVAISHLLTIDPTATLRKVSRSMIDRGVGAAVVVGAEKVVGIITERDILRAVAQEQNLDDHTVEDVMTRDVVSGTPGWDLVKAAQTMAEGGFRHLLVMEMGEPVGIVSLRDLMRAMAALLQAQDAST